MNNDIERVIYSQEDIAKRETELAQQICEDYRDKKPIIVSVLTGAILFSIDMLEKMDIYAQMDFVDVSSYQGGTGSTGHVTLLHDLKNEIKDRHVLIMEDIVDTGRTLKFLMDLLADRGAKSIKVCSLLDKPEGRIVDVHADYVGFNVPNEFLVGYGLDYQGFYRNLPYVGVLKPEVYNS